MDHEPHKPQLMTAQSALLAEELLSPALRASAPYRRLCRWFDAELESLDERFASFKTGYSAGSPRC
jgi:hypothetical protein